MLIRSLVRVRLTRFFPSDVYVKNRCAGADAILIDMERSDSEDREHEYKMRSFHRLRNSKFSLPKLLIDPVTSHSNPWVPRLITDPSVSGLALRNLDSSADSFDDINPQLAEHDTVFTMIWDTKEQRITHSIITYHRINDADIMWNSSIRSAVIGSLEHDIQPLAARFGRFKNMESAVQEFAILRQIGFTGAIIRNPNLIEMTNKVFGGK